MSMMGSEGGERAASYVWSLWRPGGRADWGNIGVTFSGGSNLLEARFPYRCGDGMGLEEDTRV